VSVVETVTGSHDDESGVSAFFALLANLRPDWQRWAACRGVGPDVFYGRPQSRPSPEALALCADCPVRQPCADAGLDEKFGVWAATSANQRARLRRLTRSVA
jgi:WhiB family transcriptional regulator, redox-sensing transcriptional regulator